MNYSTQQLVYYILDRSELREHLPQEHLTTNTILGS